jgi:hypothetical protein
LGFPLAIPVAPVVAPAAQALGATLVAGSLVNLLPSVDGFRRNTPTLPPLTGRESETTLAEKVADYINGARVQVGFPVPPPFLPPTVGLGLLATAYGLWDRLRDAAGQLWGRLNSRQGVGSQTAERPTQIPPGTTEGDLYEAPEGFSVRISDARGFGSSTTYASPLSLWWEFTSWFNEELGRERGWLWVATKTSVFRWREQSGTLFKSGGMPPDNISVQFVKSGQTPLPAAPRDPKPLWNPEPEALPDFPEPEPQTEPLPEPERPRPIVPVVAPPLPGSVPVAPPGQAPSTPGSEPQAPPAVAPRTPAYPQPTPTQQPTPTGQPTAPDGSLVPLPLPLPRLTPTNSHVINGTEVPANGPAPTLTGIAQELGRLERKSAQLLDPGRAPKAPNRDRLGNLEDYIRPLWEAFFQLFASGAYELSSPCELNEAGERVPVVVPFGPGLSALGTLHNKVDALAELLQASKDLKQPICKQTPAIGEPVTVNFEQVS